jgi:uncharacterized protein (TIGR02099 family)
MPTLANRLVHYAVYAVAAIIIAISGAALYLRLVVMPDVDRYKPDIEALASKTIGMPVSIGAIEADWWGLNPRFSLRQIRLRQSGANAPLNLSQVDATLSWLSLFVWDARLTSLVLNVPELEVRRDAQGTIYVADIPVNLPGPPSPFPDWLLRQRHVVVSDGRLTWKDELLGAPPLVLSKVNLILRNRGGKHQIGLTARPPQDSAGGLDVRAELSGRSLQHPQEWNGRVYLRADGVSMPALHRWAPWTQEQVHQGQGDVRFWLDLSKGQVSGLTGDVRLQDVRVSLAQDHRDLNFRRLSGRLGWSRNRELHTLLAHGLSFTTGDGQSVDSTDLRVQTHLAADGKLTLRSARAEKLRIEALTTLSGAVPMPRAIHTWLETHRPEGFIEHAELEWDNFRKYRLTADFADAGMRAHDRLPGFAGLNGRIVATGSGGEAQFNSTRLGLQMDQVFRHPLNFNRFSTDLVWERVGEQGLHLRIGETRVANDDLEATAQGRIELRPGHSPLLDISAHLTRGAGNAVWRYLPKQVGDNAYNWVKASITGGASADTRLVLKGPVDRFPYDKGGGEFQVAIKAKDARIHYADGWPEIHGIQGEVIFKGIGMHINVPTAQMLGVSLGPVKAVIPDLHSGDQEVLRIDGQAKGATPAFLEFIRHSPVFEHTGGFTERLKAEGQGVLALHLNLPLRNIQDATLRGDYRIVDNTLQPGKDLPTLTHLNGTLSFTESLLRGNAISTRLFGQPARLQVASEPGGRIKVGLTGQAGAAAFKEWLPASLMPYLSGSAAYEAELGLKAEQTTLKIKSDLKGMALSLPAPLDKSAEQSLPMLLTSSPGQDATHIYSLQYGQILSGKMVTGAGEAHAALYLGGGAPASLPRDPGLSIQGSLRRFDLDAWRALDLGQASGAKAPISVRNANVGFGALRAFNRVFHDTRIKATPMPQGWRLDIHGKEVIGEVMYGEAGGLPGKRLSGHFQKLSFPAQERTSAAQDGEAPTELPRILEINAQSVTIKDIELGQLNTYMEAERTGLRTRNLVISNPDGRLKGEGWVSASHRQATQFGIQLDTENAGKLLNRLGITEGLKGGAGNISGNISWLGRPEDFAMANLDGRLKLRLKSGRFTQLNPGAGRLLGILSLQALPRRITLDFRDVFSEGFSFDSIEGDLYVERGVAYIPDLVIKGPSAVVYMKGKIDLDKEEQDLRVTIQPRLDDSLAVAGAILGGPVVGVGALVASKVLQNPIAKAATFEYLIKGSWSEPQVSKLARPKAAPAETPLTP